MYLKFIALSTLLFLQGCSFHTWDRGKEISSRIIAPLPHYSINDVFIFTNGYIERVSNINGDIIDWEVSGGAFNYKAHTNFTLPLISWETKTKKGYNDINIQDKRVLWPLTPGEDYRIGLKKNINKKDIAFSNRFFFQDWICETNDPRKIVVPAGTFNTTPVTCKLKSFYGNIIRTRTWFYAPAIGHYVKRVDNNPSYNNRIGKITEYDLSSYIPAFSNISLPELKNAEAHLQISLDNLPSGNEAKWESSDKTTSRNIYIIETFKTKDQRFCRNVIFNTISPLAKKTYTTVFCRDTDSWKIAVVPRMNSN